MDAIDLVMLLGSFGAIGAWIYMLHRGEKEARKRLGPDVVEIRLYRRWTYRMQWVILAVAILMPISLVVVAITHRIPMEEAFIEFGRALWPASLFYALRKASVLLIGSRGISFGPGPQGEVTWDRVEELGWDRDIGQQLWGFTLTVRVPKQKRPTKTRLYVPRDLKDEVARQLEHFRGSASGNGADATPLPKAPALA